MRSVCGQLVVVRLEADQFTWRDEDAEQNTHNLYAFR